MPPPKKTQCFDLSLCLAGAISAGAYTAGVVDFLLLALQEWEKERVKNPAECLKHRVRLRAVAGASAGGMTGGMLAALLCDKHDPLGTHADGSLALGNQSPRPSEANRLYKSWVTDIDIEALLSLDDLDEDPTAIRSLLNSSALDPLAESAVAFTPSNEWPRYLAERFDAAFTITNLRGVPYSVGMNSEVHSQYLMSRHADCFLFSLSPDPAKIAPGAIWLDPASSGSYNWNLMRETALACGAFPIGLAARRLESHTTKYEVPSQCGGAPRPGIKPRWPENVHSGSGYTYPFLAVDGGVMNNEPLAIAEGLIGLDDDSPTQADAVTSASIMIDPFPGLELIGPGELKKHLKGDLLSVVGNLVRALLNQARFKPEELGRAASADDYARYMIAPLSERVNRTRGVGVYNGVEYHLASATLGGFGGFLSQQFRQRDFQLGRRNCQRFLTNWFVMPLADAEKNPVLGQSGAELLKKRSFEAEGKAWVPILPCYGRAAVPIVESPSWDDIAINQTRWDQLQDWIRRRSRRLIKTVELSGMLAVLRFLLSSPLAEGATNEALKTIDSELEGVGLKKYQRRDKPRTPLPPHRA